MEISPEWILGALATLAGVISTLAGITCKRMNDRLAEQDRTINKLQERADQLSKGGGVVECLWKKR